MKNELSKAWVEDKSRRVEYPNGVCSIMVFHNHPSGDTEPSELDVQTTKRINKAGNLMGIPLVDHIIVGTENSYSLRESGVISDEINMPNEIDEE